MASIGVGAGDGDPFPPVKPGKYSPTVMLKYVHKLFDDVAGEAIYST